MPDRPRTIFRLRADRVMWHEDEGETVVLDLQRSAYFSLNATASALWPLLLGGASRSQLVEELVVHHDANSHKAGADVDAFLVDLDARGLFEAN